jgi:hypothetical protein
MPDTMLDQATRALLPYIKFSESGDPYSTQEAAARAALMAIREPTDAFIERISPHSDGLDARQLWNRMIDAVLVVGV